MALDLLSHFPSNDASMALENIILATQCRWMKNEGDQSNWLTN
jgi:hypothetical protein